ncbi:MAG: A24 family peptidase [Planctomycetota bacterium]
MPHEFYILLPRLAWLCFVFAVGGCVGSLINVLAYRLPRGIGVVTPASRCPYCETKLRWKDNIPIVGWLFLRGRCRYCRTPISPEYPLIELAVACLFAGFYVLWYMIPENRGTTPGFEVLGLDLGAIRPEWTLVDRFNGVPMQSAPLFFVLLLLLGTLFAMTLTDLKTTMIPLVLPWFATLVGIAGHTAYAGYMSLQDEELARVADGARWSIPTYGWTGLGLGAGGVLGIGVSLVLLKLGLIRRSFADAESWEAQHREELGLGASDSNAAENGDASETGQWKPGRGWMRTPLVIVASTLACAVAGGIVAGALGTAPGVGVIIGTAAGPVVAGVPLRLLTPAPPKADQPTDAEVWTAYPHARREMVKELAFLAPPVALAWLGYVLAGRAEGLIPLWLDVLGGALLGYLVGGGVVWAIRIGGSLGFGKEAMGLGDVHLMAAVGACLGWIDATLAFFLASLVGILLTIYTLALSRSVARAMPFGPALAIATVLVLLGKPAIEHGLTLITGRGIDLP